MKLIVGNFKMNLTKNDINEYLEHLKNENYSNVVFCPSAIYLQSFIDNGHKVGSQDIGIKDQGAYTGDISSLQLKSIGVQYSIIGHSERRKYYQDDKYVNQKLSSSLNNSIYPILCIGESQEEKNHQLTKKVLQEEIDSAFNNIQKDLLNKVIIAYEPLWSIGTGNIPTNEEIKEIISFIKEYILNNYTISIKVLYGGSVNNNNINSLEEINSIDGYLIGGTSIDINQFKDLINKVNRI